MANINVVINLQVQQPVGGTRGVTLFLFSFIIKNKYKDNLYIYKINIKK
jgi:hypothetical protein